MDRKVRVGEENTRVQTYYTGSIHLQRYFLAVELEELQDMREGYTVGFCEPTIDLFHQHFGRFQKN